MIKLILLFHTILHSFQKLLINFIIILTLKKRNKLVIFYKKFFPEFSIKNSLLDYMLWLRWILSFIPHHIGIWIRSHEENKDKKHKYFKTIYFCSHKIKFNTILFIVIIFYVRFFYLFFFLHKGKFVIIQWIKYLLTWVNIK